MGGNAGVDFGKLWGIFWKNIEIYSGKCEGNYGNILEYILENMEKFWKILEPILRDILGGNDETDFVWSFCHSF